MIQIHEIASHTGLLQLKEEWNTLNLSSIFLEFDWINTWWHHFQENKKLWILVAREEGNILAIL